MTQPLDSITLRAPAKVNLFLDVLNRRPDGFHDIYSLFQTVSLFDTLTFSRISRGEIELVVRGDGAVPLGEDNLVARAARALQQATGHAFGVRVELEKRIPIAAGLGGGSSDAATTLVGVNRLLGLGLSDRHLIDIGATIGSDIPFFFSSGQALVSGRGEKVDETTLPTDYFLVLVTPPVPSHTAVAYSALGRGLTGSLVPDSFIACRSFAELLSFLERRRNDFEPVLHARLPVLKDIFDRLHAAEAVLVRLSGSGPTMFGMYRDDPTPKLVSLRNWLPGVRLCIVRPVRTDWSAVS